jgi:hypothetical protein
MGEKAGTVLASTTGCVVYFNSLTSEARSPNPKISFSHQQIEDVLLVLEYSSNISIRIPFMLVDHMSTFAQSAISHEVQKENWVLLYFKFLRTSSVVMSDTKGKTFI